MAFYEVHIDDVQVGNSAFGQNSDGEFVAGTVTETHRNSVVVKTEGDEIIRVLKDENPDWTWFAKS